MQRRSQSECNKYIARKGGRGEGALTIADGKFAALQKLLENDIFRLTDLQTILKQIFNII